MDNLEMKKPTSTGVRHDLKLKILVNGETIDEYKQTVYPDTVSSRDSQIRQMIIDRIVDYAQLGQDIEVLVSARPNYGDAMSHMDCKLIKENSK